MLLADADLDQCSGPQLRLNNPPSGPLTEPFACCSKAVHRHLDDLLSLLIPARHDATINSAVNCLCRQHVRSAVYFHDLKRREAVLANAFSRLVYLVSS